VIGATSGTDCSFALLLAQKPSSVHGNAQAETKLAQTLNASLKRDACDFSELLELNPKQSGHNFWKQTTAIGA
jgi:hypothetical protein